MRPASRSCSSQSQAARCQATRLWTCSRSTRSAEERELSLELRRPSSPDGVQIFVATKASPRRSASARPSTRSARPYIGEESTSRRAARRKRRPRRRRRHACLGVRRRSVRPRPEPHDGQLDAGAPECPPLHTVCRPCPRRAYWTRPSSPRPGSTRGLPARTSRSSRCWRRAAAVRTCAPSTGSPASSTISATRRPAIATRCSTSSSASSMGRREQRSCAVCTQRSPTAGCRSSPSAGSSRRTGSTRCASRYETWADDTRVLHVLGRSGRAPRARHLRARGRARARRHERRRLHRAPARQLPPGPAPRPLARARLPAAGGPAALRRRGRRSRGPLTAPRRGAASLRRRSRALAPGAGPAACDRRSEGGPGCRSPSTRAGAWRPSTRSSGPAGTSSAGGRRPTRLTFARLAVRELVRR